MYRSEKGNRSENGESYMKWRNTQLKVKLTGEGQSYMRR